MYPLEFLFALLQKYTPVPQSRYEQIKLEADAWWSSKEVEDNRFGKMVKLYGQKWWCQLLLASLYIFAIRWVHDFMNPSPDADNQSGRI